MDISDFGVEDVETTHTASVSGWRTYEASKLKEPGTIEVELNVLDSDGAPPIGQANETITVTFESGRTWACDGYMKGFSMSGQLEGAFTGTATLKLSGVPTVTAV